MEIADQQTYTLGQAARLLGRSIDELLQRVHLGELSARAEPGSGRLLVGQEDIERLREEAGKSTD